MRRRSERGVVLAQVLITTVILGYIAAMILRMVLQPAMVAANATQSASDAKKAEAAINRVQAAWIDGGDVCKSNAGLGVLCYSASCGCTCKVTLSDGVQVDVKSAGTNVACRLSATPRSP